MSTLHLVDPELRPLLELFPQITLSEESLPAIRSRNLPGPPVEDANVIVEERLVTGAAGARLVPILVYRPKQPHAGTVGGILHIHGGGYVGGSAREFEFLVRPLVGELGCVAVSVDYRLAPEETFPAAIEDCYAALGWFITEADALGVDASRIGLMGESAGGGLAAALALLARDRGEHAVAFQHLTYPMLDDRTVVRAPHAFTGEFVCNADSVAFGWRSLLGRDPGSADVSPYAAPSRAADLAGLPPAYVMTGTLDYFLDEDVEYARRLIAAGVPTELLVLPGAFHGFDLVPGTGVGDRARAARLDALRRALG